MKLYVLSLFILSFFVFAQSQSKQHLVKNAKMSWKGEKIVGGHQGTINLKSGTLIVDNDKVKGGKFIVEMASIDTTDLDGEGKKRLNEHLKSSDFFNVNAYPESQLEFTRIVNKSENQYQITGDLTIKGITKPISFSFYARNGKASGRLTIDRTKYGIKFGSSNFFEGLGDYAIADDFEVEITFNY